MSLPNDEDPKLAEYAHPERLVTTGWLAKNLGAPGLVVVESDEDVLLYDRAERPGHAGLPGRRSLRATARREGHLA